VSECTAGLEGGRPRPLAYKDRTLEVTPVMMTSIIRLIQGTFGVVQGTFGVIWRTFGVIWRTFGVIWRTFGVIQMMMIIIGPLFGHFGLWTSSQGFR
jgi:hypothetical protein